jgi:RND family efflux transporter MFP subunit
MKRGLVLLPLLVLAACGKKGSEVDAPKPVAEVKTAVIQSATFPDTVTAYGAVEFGPGGEHGLSAPGEANIRQVLASPGTRVAAGQPVMILQPSAQFKLDLEKAAQDARTSTQAYARAQRLRTDGLVSDAEVETARATAAAAQESVTSLRKRASQLTITAPTSGVVETVTGAPGDLVAAGANLGKVGALGALALRLGVDPQLAATLRPGAPVRVTRIQGGDPISAVIRSVDPRADPQTRLASVILAERAGPNLAPGDPVKGEIVRRQVSGVYVPRAAVYYDKDQPYLMVVDKALAKRREVKLGIAITGEEPDDAKIQITEGLQSGERIIVEGGASLDDGATVKEAGAKAPAKEG